MRVGVLAPETSWHFRDLKRASNSFGDELELLSVDFSTLAASVENEHQEQFYDQSGFLNSLNSLIVRTMPKGSLQQIVFRMDTLHRLARTGVRVINSPRSVEIAIDKYLSLSLMAEHQIPVPPFSVCQTVEQGMRAFEELGRDVVLKPIFGSMGMRIHRLQEEATARNVMADFVDDGEVLYLQKFVDHGGSDIRVLVVGDEIFSMRRMSSDGGWLTNIARGGSADQHEATSREIELARAAAKINCCEIAGVDIVYAEDSDAPMVLEVNASPGWEAIQNVSKRDVAASVLELVCNRSFNGNTVQ